MTDPVADKWGDAEFTHTLAHVGWMASTAVLMHLNERATGDPARDWLSAWAPNYLVGDDLRVLVLGCGEGWLERALAQRPYVAHIDAMDLAADAVARAAAAGVAKIRYRVADLNLEELPPDSYDAVIAHSILHHVENLEHAYAQIERTLRRDGTLIVNEYVGPNRFQFGDDVSSMINALLRCLPERLRRGTIEQRVYERKERPPEALMQQLDPSEAVRSAELVAFTAGRFEILDRRDLGGTLLQHLLYDIVPNFRFDDPRERAMIELMCTIEGALVDAGTIPSDFVLLAARKRGSTLPRSAYRRPLPRRPPAAKSTDPDPLQWSRHRPGGGVPPSRRHLHAAWLRALRIALASTQDHRRPLFRESPLRTWLEHRRFSRSGLTASGYVIQRAAHADEAILALLQTFATLDPG